MKGCETMDALSRSILTLDGMLQLRAEELRREAKQQESKERTLMNLEDVDDYAENYDFTKSKYPPFKGWDDDKKQTSNQGNLS